ncbi:MAG: pentapeptide repeat-containing protein, partial [Caldisericaceae bacterium]|nr:pentapeptide repeat-containing protein [Caldisericaceae bacterium]
KCKYKYKNYPNKKCPHNAEPGSDFYKWHEPKDGKDFSGQEIKEKDLVEAYLVKANLKIVKFQEKADLRLANLREAYSPMVDFQKTNLLKANLQGAFMVCAKFQKADLGQTILKKTNLSDANLQGAYLGDAILQGADLFISNLQKTKLYSANIQGANLSRSNLTDALLNNETDLRGAVLYAAEIKNAKRLQYAKISGKNPGEMCIEELLADNIHNLFNSKETDFGKALNGVIKPYIKKLGFNEEENASEQFEICKDIYIPDEEPFEKIFEKRPISPYKETEIRLYLYKMAKEVYINLKNYFKNAGLYDESGNFFIGEFRVRGKISEISAKQTFYELFERTKNFFRIFILRKREENKTYMPETKTLKLIGSMILNYSSFLMNKILYITSSYGESWPKIIFTALSVIGICALFYWWKSGIVYSACSNPARGFSTNLYFSIVTFTTLGYGDLHPASTGARIVAGFEAFLGAFLLAYFVVIVSRKIMR